ncbi:nitrate/nitrite two-component system sensor histidine kinase NarX, partial [Klebsiella pneumoniae]|nr:nitrate/nitrite two-component system sensor histidine kinase NarX [Klebsiella pneumoniae]
NEVRLVVADNVRGVPDNAERSKSEGLISIREHAQRLRGDCHVRRRETGGTEVSVTFIPEITFSSQGGDPQESTGTGNYPS